MSHFIRKTYYIYALINPDTGEPYYVGQTDNPKIRLSQHLSIYNFNRHTREFLDAGKKPSMEILQHYEGDSSSIVQWLEMAWINRMLDKGYSLGNAALRLKNNIHFLHPDSNRFLVCEGEVFDCEHPA